MTQQTKNEAPKQSNLPAQVSLDNPLDASLPPAYDLDAFTDKVARYTLSDGGVAIGRYLGRQAKNGNLMMATGLDRYDSDGRRVPGQQTIDPKDILTIEEPGFSHKEWEAFNQKWIQVTMIDGTRYDAAFVSHDERCNVVFVSSYTRYAPDGKELFKRGWGQINNAYVNTVVEIESPKDD